MMAEEQVNKSLILNLERFLEDDNSAFVLDEKEDLELFMACLDAIKNLDDLVEYYVVTYPDFGDGHIYADNVLIRTKLSREQLQDIFSEHSEIEPYQIEKMSTEEKESAEWVDLSVEKYQDSSGNIFSLYWD